MDQKWIERGSRKDLKGAGMEQDWSKNGARMEQNWINNASRIDQKWTNY